MALIWQENSNSNEYQIRSAGKSLRLYRNGVFHTQYHPQRIVTGDIWELLLLASLNIPANARVLVLGVGGGAIINLLNYFVKPAHIDVLDIDETILELCKRFFLSEKENVSFYCADARQWVSKKGKSKGKTTATGYDLIIEDVFGEQDGQPKRIFPFDKPWLEELDALLDKTGRLVTNFETSAQYRNSPAIQDPQVLQKLAFKSAIRFSSPRYQNNIVMFAKTDIQGGDVRKTILETPLLRKQHKHYYLRTIKLS